MEFENTEVWGFRHALRGMRNPMNSWNKSDTIFYNVCEECDYCDERPDCVPWRTSTGCVMLGEEDLKLCQKLLKAGNEHCKFMRMIHVAVDSDMPRYWWSEADTYHFNTKNSCSTIHKLLNNENPITIDMFIICEEDRLWWENTVAELEMLRTKYKHIQSTSKDSSEMERLLVRAKRMLPEGFLQMRTWDTTYAELRNMYFQRRHHRLKEEWIDVFCKWVEALPYAKELICYEKQEEDN